MSQTESTYDRIKSWTIPFQQCISYGEGNTLTERFTHVPLYLCIRFWCTKGRQSYNIFASFFSAVMKIKVYYMCNGLRIQCSCGNHFGEETCCDFGYWMRSFSFQKLFEEVITVSIACTEVDQRLDQFVGGELHWKFYKRTTARRTQGLQCPQKASSGVPWYVR